MTSKLSKQCIHNQYERENIEKSLPKLNKLNQLKPASNSQLWFTALYPPAVHEENSLMSDNPHLLGSQSCWCSCCCSLTSCCCCSWSAEWLHNYCLNLHLHRCCRNHQRCLWGRASAASPFSADSAWWNSAVAAMRSRAAFEIRSAQRKSSSSAPAPRRFWAS